MEGIRRAAPGIYKHLVNNGTNYIYQLVQVIFTYGHGHHKHCVIFVHPLFTLPKTNNSPWKLIVGRWSFPLPFGAIDLFLGAVAVLWVSRRAISSCVQICVVYGFVTSRGSAKGWESLLWISGTSWGSTSFSILVADDDVAHLLSWK